MQDLSPITAPEAYNADETKTRPAKARLLARSLPLMGCLSIVSLVGITTINWTSWISERAVQTTQNAFVKADIAVLSARIGGNIDSLPVGDYEYVTAGDTIATIDRQDYELRVSATVARLAEVQANLDNLINEEAEQRAAIEVADANLQAANVRYNQFERELARQLKLLETGTGTQRAFDAAQADRDSASTSRMAAKAALQLSQEQLAVLSGQRRLRQSERQAAEIAMSEARLALTYTRITAPCDGVINKKHVQVGSFVTTGTQVVSIVPAAQPHVIANYKETQLSKVKTGQPVTLTIDALPGLVFRGRVARLAPATAAETALLPSDNATGNFTKIVQRIPVRVALDPKQSDLQLLKPGMSAEAAIDTHAEEIASYDQSADVQAKTGVAASVVD